MRKKKIDVSVGSVASKYPGWDWVCAKCCLSLGARPRGNVATYHEDICDICGKNVMVTEPRDWSFKKEELCQK